MSAFLNPGARFRRMNHKTDRAMMLRFLGQIIVPGACSENRVFNTGRNGNAIIRGERYSKTMAGRFRRPEYAFVAADLVYGLAVYITVNPVSASLYKPDAEKLAVIKTGEGANDKTVICRRWLYIDIDCQRPVDTGATQEELDAALAVRDRILENEPVLKASAIWGCSGNGGWILVRLPDYPNDPEHRDLCHRVLRKLARTYGTKGRDTIHVDVTTYNASRVMCLPGTLKCKGPDDPDRPWRMVTIDSPPDKPAPLCDLGAWDAAEPPLEEPKPAESAQPALPLRNGKAPSASQAGRPDAAERCRMLLWDPKFPKSVAGQGGHNALMHGAHVVINDFGLNNDVGFGIYSDWNLQTACPPESLEQIRHKWESALAKHPVPSCRALNEDRPYGGEPRAKRPITVNQADRRAVPAPEAARDPRHRQLNELLAVLSPSDLGNAERLVARHGKDLRCCHPWHKWLHYDGTRWGVDRRGIVRNLARQTVRDMLFEAATIHSKEERQVFLEWILRSESKERIAAMLHLAEAENDIPILPEELDSDPWLYNVANGTLDLRTLTLRPHRREDLISKISPTPYVPNAACPIWEKTLRRIFADNDRLIAFFQKICGLTLVGTPQEQFLPILHGEGANGKSTIVNTLMDVHGPDYALKATPDLLLTHKGEVHPTERASLFGKRLVAGCDR